MARDESKKESEVYSSGAVEPRRAGWRAAQQRDPREGERGAEGEGQMRLARSYYVGSFHAKNAEGAPGKQMSF